MYYNIYKDMSQSLRISFFEQYGAIGSQPIFDAFKKGLEKNGSLIKSHDMDSDVAVIWSVLWRGKMSQNKIVWDRYRNSGRPVIVLESGTLDRGRLFRVGLNGINLGCYDYITERDPARAEKLNLKLMDWTDKGEYILLCTQHHTSQQWAGKEDLGTYIENTIKTVRNFSDRRIVLRSHPRNRISYDVAAKFKNVTHSPARSINESDDFYRVLDNAFITINYSSSPGIESVIRGRPVIVGPNSLAYPMTSRFEDLENPKYPDRKEWFRDICHTEWSKQELESGSIQRQLLTMIESST
jgi:hypothetical protein